MYEALVLLSEVVLSAYPMLIKLVDASVFAQTGLRMTVFAVLAAVAAVATGTIGAAEGLAAVLAEAVSPKTLGTGLLNLAHVLASYAAFSQLPAGNAMALFYTYPIWNLLGAAATIKGESLPWSTMPWMLVALVGAVLLARPSTTQWSMLGVLAALVAAVTETGIYLWFRKEAINTPATAEEPWTGMFRLYGGSAILWGVAAAVLALTGGLAATTWRMTSGGFGAILLFNSFVGFLGYALRFFTIPKVSTVAFSAMSFFGVVAAYGMDWLFTGTLPTLLQAAGAAAIVLANTVLIRKETV